VRVCADWIYITLTPGHLDLTLSLAADFVKHEDAREQLFVNISGDCEYPEKVAAILANPSPKLAMISLVGGAWSPGVERAVTAAACKTFKHVFSSLSIESASILLACMFVDPWLAGEWEAEPTTRREAVVRLQIANFGAYSLHIVGPIIRDMLHALPIRSKADAEAFLHSQKNMGCDDPAVDMVARVIEASRLPPPSPDEVHCSRGDSDVMQQILYHAQWRVTHDAFRPAPARADA